jgi:hypothetical protein
MANLAFERTGDFWARALAIASATDFLQKFSHKGRDNDIEVKAQHEKFFTSVAPA